MFWKKKEWFYIYILNIYICSNKLVTEYVLPVFVILLTNLIF